MSAQIRLGVRLPPVGEPLVSLLAGWRARHPNVALTIVEMNEPSHGQSPGAPPPGCRAHHQLHALLAPRQACRSMSNASTAAVPHDHALAARESVDWADLRDEDILIQEWDESQATRELYASLLGQSVRFSAHAGEQAERLRAGRRGIWRHAGDREPGRGHRARRRVPADRRDECVLADRAGLAS